MNKKYDTHAQVEGLFETKRIELYDENNVKGKDAPPYIEVPLKDADAIPGLFGMSNYNLPALIFLEMDELAGFTEFGSVLKPVIAVELTISQCSTIKEFFKEGT